MAVQWLSHQTGLEALAGCSGVLETERERERKIKDSTEEGNWGGGGGGVLCVYVWADGSEKEEIKEKRR